MLERSRDGNIAVLARDHRAVRNALDAAAAATFERYRGSPGALDPASACCAKYSIIGARTAAFFGSISARCSSLKTSWRRRALR